MKAGRFFSVAAERAVAAGRPVHHELEIVGGLAGGIPFPAQRAIDFARHGKLGEALGALIPLGFDPLLADAAAFRPETAVEVSAALARLPRSTDLWRPLLGTCHYLALVLMVESVVAQLFAFRVVPGLASGAALPDGQWAYLSVLGQVGFWLALAVVLAAWVAPLFDRSHRWLFGPLADARVCAAFAPLAAAGVPAEAAFELARRHAPGFAGDAARQAHGTLDWPELALHFAERAELRFDRLALLAKGAFTALALALAALILASVYLTLPLLWTGVSPS